MRRILPEALGSLAGVARREPVLVAAGLLGVAIAAALGGVIAVRGPLIPPEGFLEKPLTFDLAIGIYVLTLAALVPLAGFSRRGGAAWRAGVVSTTLYAYAVETTHSLRGMDPRFSRVAGPVDAALGAGLGLDALVIIVLFSILAVRIFLRSSMTGRPLLVLGVRYGVASVVLGGFVAGFWMGMNLGRHVGESGSILPLHALGFHGLQAVPIVGWLLERARVAPGRARRRVHAAGIVWLAAVAAVGVQTVLGRTVAALSPATIAALAALVVWAAVALAALGAARSVPGAPAARQ